ncbi:MAG: outer membrane beta-barrel protein [Deltaproteobacteria bacterium]|nr:outer membrane beta-barrel protein [Deltaproteobacteria bacterium]
MKKTLSLLTAFLAFAPFSSKAESKAGGLQLSGNIDVVTGWQHDDSNALGTPVGGQLGWFRGATAPKHDTFNFYLDQVELDLNKTYGENIRMRADIDLGRELSGTGRNTEGFNMSLEQAYVTVGVGGAELLVGRFNVPIGYYVVDRADNPTISFSNIFNYVTPANATGAKLYYSFNDLVDLNVYVVNNLADSVAFGNPIAGGTTVNPGGLASYSAIPSYGMRLGFNWGKDNTKSTVGFSYAGGPERFGCNGGGSSCNKHLTNLADLDFAVKFTPEFLLAGELVYRQDNSNILGIKNDKVWGGFVVANYDLNEAWRVFFRYGFLQDRSGYYTATNQNMHDFALGLGYQITDGAKLKLEYSPTIFDPRGTGAKTSWSHGFAAELAYNF